VDSEPGIAERLGFPQYLENGQRIGAPPADTVQRYAQLLKNAGVHDLIVVTEGDSANDVSYLSDVGRRIYSVVTG
jgi:hypothetical protein